MPLIQAAAIAATLAFQTGASQTGDRPDRCTSPQIIGTAKALYNLRPPAMEADRPIGALIRTETESFGTDARRQRVEWIAPDGGLLLSFVEFYDGSDKPYGALYVEEGELEPTLEAFTWSANDSVKTVEYRKATGEVTSRARYIYDEQGREIERQYGLDGDSFSSRDTVSWEGKNETGYTWSKVDGTASISYRYTVEKVDGYGNWTQRKVSREGVDTMREIRSLSYDLKGC